MKFVRFNGVAFFCLRLINRSLFRVFRGRIQFDWLGLRLYRVVGGIGDETVNRVKFTVFSARFFFPVLDEFPARLEERWSRSKTRLKSR